MCRKCISSPASFEWKVVNTNSQGQHTNAQGRNVQDTNAPDTQIMSVVDSNNVVVLNESSVSISSSSAESPNANQFGTSGSAGNKTASNTVANPITFSFAGQTTIILLEVMSALVMCPLAFQN